VTVAMENTHFFILFDPQASLEYCLEIVMDLDCPNQTWGKTLFCTYQTNSQKCL